MPIARIIYRYVVAVIFHLFFAPIQVEKHRPFKVHKGKKSIIPTTNIATTNTCTELHAYALLVVDKVNSLLNLLL